MTPQGGLGVTAGALRPQDLILLRGSHHSELDNQHRHSDGRTFKVLRL